MKNAAQKTNWMIPIACMAIIASVVVALMKMANTPHQQQQSVVEQVTMVQEEPTLATEPVVETNLVQVEKDLTCTNESGLSPEMVAYMHENGMESFSGFSMTVKTKPEVVHQQK